MGDEIINANEIYIQDSLQELVFQNPKHNDVGIYNLAVNYIDIQDFNTALRVLKLIHLNQNILKNW